MSRLIHHHPSQEGIVKNATNVCGKTSPAGQTFTP